jgi:glycosyltransferase involved in cell wall biosynthesis
MKILVYAPGIHRGGGPANHLRRFLLTLSTIDTRFDWAFIVNKHFELPEGLDRRLEIRAVDVSGALDRLYQDLWRSRLLAEHSDTDVLVNLADFGPVPAHLPVLTFQRNPNYYDTRLLELRRGASRLQWELRRRLAHWIVRRSDRVLCPSRTMADQVATTVGLTDNRVGVLHHPFDPGQMMASPWTPSRPRRLLYVGHLMPHKNHRWLLDVYAASGLAVDGVELWMTAAREDWPDGYDALVDLIRRLGKESMVRLLGRVPPDEVVDLYRTSTVFVFASLGESFGFPLVEAMAAGTPTLALDTPIAREICGDGARYLPADIDLAAAQLRDAVLNGPELELWSRSARRRASEFCVSWPEWCGRLEDELDALHAART